MQTKTNEGYQIQKLHFYNNVFLYNIEYNSINLITREILMEKRLMMFLAGLFLSIGMALAQTQATGTVTAAEDGAPIIGASIKVVGTKTGTVTDINGNFKMDVPANAKLEVSYIGMTTKTIKAGKNLNIVLGADERSLEEIVISVPYGT